MLLYGSIASSDSITITVCEPNNDVWEPQEYVTAIKRFSSEIEIIAFHALFIYWHKKKIQQKQAPTTAKELTDSARNTWE